MKRLQMALALLLAPLALVPASAHNGEVRAAAELAEARRELAEANAKAQVLAQRNAILEAKTDLTDEAIIWRPMQDAITTHVINLEAA